MGVGWPGGSGKTACPTHGHFLLAQSVAWRNRCEIEKPDDVAECV